MNEIRLRLFLKVVWMLLCQSNALSIHKRSVDGVTNEELLDAIDTIQRAKLQETLAAAAAATNMKNIYFSGYPDNALSEDLPLIYNDVSYDLQSIDNKAKETQSQLDNGISVNSEIHAKIPLQQAEVVSIFESPTDGVEDNDKDFVDVSELKVVMAPEQVANIFNNEESEEIQKDSQEKEVNANDGSSSQAADREAMKNEGTSNNQWLQTLSDSAVLDVSDKNKAKRSAFPLAETFDNKLKSKAIDILKIYVVQQEEENRHLAKALSLAARSQAERTDKYVPDEISELQAAAANEHLINTIRNIIASESLSEETEEKREVNRLSVNPVAVWSDGSKENESNKKRLQALTYDQTLEAAPNAHALVEEADKDKLKMLFTQNGGRPEENRHAADRADESLLEKYNRYRLNPFLRNVEESDSLDASENSDNIPASAACGAIDNLTDNCLAARMNLLMLDDEAVQLCNRHQVCYACGVYHGISSDFCDRIYTTEVAIACSEEEDDSMCHKEAFGLYAVIVKKHKYTQVGDSKTECASPCVYEYIVGSNRR